MLHVSIRRPVVSSPVPVKPVNNLLVPTNANSVEGNLSLPGTVKDMNLFIPGKGHSLANFVVGPLHRVIPLVNMKGYTPVTSHSHANFAECGS